MEHYLNQFMEFAQDNTLLAYTALFVSAFVENIFPPIPGDTVTLIGAYLVGTGHLNYVGVIASTTAGSVVGFMVLFLLAYWLEWKIVEKYDFKWMKRAHIDKVQTWFQKYGYRVILANRFLSGVRSVISITAGLSKLRTSMVLLWCFLSALVWNSLIILAGALIGDNWQDIQRYLKLYNQIIIIGLSIAVVAYLVYFFLYKKKLFRD